jgi:hypothetical protein
MWLEFTRRRSRFKRGVGPNLSSSLRDLSVLCVSAVKRRSKTFNAAEFAEFAEFAAIAQRVEFWALATVGLMPRPLNRKQV